jgi:hypothetical protein
VAPALITRLRDSALIAKQQTRDRQYRSDCFSHAVGRRAEKAEKLQGHFKVAALSGPPCVAEVFRRIPGPGTAFLGVQCGLKEGAVKIRKRILALLVEDRGPFRSQQEDGFALVRSKPRRIEREGPIVGFACDDRKWIAGARFTPSQVVLANITRRVPGLPQGAAAIRDCGAGESVRMKYIRRHHEKPGCMFALFLR